MLQKQKNKKTLSDILVLLWGSCFCGADLGGLVLVGWVALALMLLGPLSLQVRPDDGFKRHCPPHARAQLVQSALSRCEMQTYFYFLKATFANILVSVFSGQISQ